MAKFRKSIWTNIGFLKMAKYELYSCSCLFEECAKSKYEGESYSDLIVRICAKNLKKQWITRCACSPHLHEKKYVACFTHCQRILESIALSSAQHSALVNSCSRRLFTENLSMHCFRFFSEEDMNVSSFCFS